MNLSRYFSFKTYKTYVQHLLFGGGFTLSYSQCAEDILIKRALETLGIKTPHYIEIGTNQPRSKNNTYIFYAEGASGVCIEPDPELFKEIQRVRARDICLNIGIGPTDKDTAPYYVLTSKALNTFIKEEAEESVKNGHYGTQKIEQIIQIPLMSIETLMKTYFHAHSDILSLDTEGLDFQIIKNLDLTLYRPKVICIETARYNSTGKIEKEKEIIDYMHSHEYITYADTFINTIFVDKKIWPI